MSWGVEEVEGMAAADLSRAAASPMVELRMQTLLYSSWAVVVAAGSSRKVAEEAVAEST
jgi:hypothetical protein